MIKKSKITVIVMILIVNTIAGQSILKIDTAEEWNSVTSESINCEINEAVDIGGIIDLMGNGSLMLQKISKDSIYTLTQEFETQGNWESEWIEYSENTRLNSILFDILVYGEKIDMTKGWKKFDNNPIVSGGNTLLPLNLDNITDQTILLPDPPGGVPQDQAIFKGKGNWEGKWILMFNHTPNAWPFEYYWSFVVADSLSPLKDGINPFKLASENYPLFGPIDNQAPNDWLEVNGVYYAPDETYQSMAHLWKSDDMISWYDLGVIENKTGTDPGIIYDGKQYHLFSENGNTISHCYLDLDSVKGSNNQDVLDVGDHTGDADVAYFNNQWHMFVDDGVHLKYKISYASTSPNSFPYGWQLFPEIYGPHNPEQGQLWDDDNEQGNNFGTGDADIALEEKTLYLFTERPIGVAFKELTELNNSQDQLIEVMIIVDNDGNGVPDDSTGWIDVNAGESILNLEHELNGKSYKIKYRFNSEKSNESPLIKSFEFFSHEE